tara:strand:- start:875 stop:1018 length:144 start_codon:yes stop_codon:yes gene_type:complete
MDFEKWYWRLRDYIGEEQYLYFVEAYADTDPDHILEAQEDLYGGEEE